VAQRLYKIVHEEFVMAKNLEGQKFNYLTVIKSDFFTHKGFHFYKWICRCDCGKEISIFQGELLLKNRLACSRKCVKVLENFAKNKVGQKCGKFYCKEFIQFKNYYHDSIYRFQCFCGKEFVSTWKSTIRKLSCGCIKMLNKQSSILHMHLLNSKFGKLQPLKCFIKNNETYVLCRCDCGNTKTIRGMHLKNSTRSCGCLAKENMYKIGKINGPEKGCYNHSLTEKDRLEQKHRYRTLNPELEQWKNFFRKKYDYTCQICKIKTKKIQVHHFSSWSTDIENRFNLENGTTICKSCHIAFHKKYGKGNNNKKQFYEFQKLYPL
jgi:5-methylcytosine-specific restriction endonuclease McrA